MYAVIERLNAAASRSQSSSNGASWPASMASLTLSDPVSRSIDGPQRNWSGCCRLMTSIRIRAVRTGR